MKVLGLMSGTSADGVDAVLASFAGPATTPRWELLGRAAVPYPADLRQRLIAFGQGDPCSAAAILELAEAVTDVQAEAALACDPQGQAELVGCHGQTVWHRPPAPEHEGNSWQLLQATRLAARLGRAVVHDFRAADLALAGQGAPLVPPADAALLGRIDGWRGVLNLGGIANLTLIPPAHGPERHASLLGWDCGPANTLVDLAVERFSGGRHSFDAGGAWASRGHIDHAVVETWLQEPYFQQAPPKSTGRELFGRTDLERRLQDLRVSAGLASASSPAASSAPAELEPADVLASLTAFSAAAVAQELRHGPQPVELLLAGGGARNQLLVAQLRQRCRGVIVRPLADFGLQDSDREALAFALLAWWNHRGHPGNAPAVTGARRSSLLGVWVPPPGSAPG
ncbi:anhydro-N-acetylmuramic acid kinase [Cyanobium sp. LEGE 06113]|uniref:anhydro-N-acetylmuramic acid kinase n=1 Tax=Cyanobium sp. LEGE 06113 TaxID=1297573 RepID=UPI00187FBA0F|nr:anhydro-N-acetylmuramic acid kinase [Cyanobium sp. LEGE 06113]MBE9153940.1 anhydro-N-acetylmuramic acid kinase [Cyanobium sp. LEGE 06113]